MNEAMRRKVGRYKGVMQAIKAYGDPSKMREAPARLLALHAMRHALAVDVLAELSRDVDAIPVEPEAKRPGWRPPECSAPTRPKAVVPPLPTFEQLWDEAKRRAVNSPLAEMFDALSRPRVVTVGSDGKFGIFDTEKVGWVPDDSGCPRWFISHDGARRFRDNFVGHFERYEVRELPEGIELRG